MILKFKKLDENAVIPQFAKQGDAGMDLTAVTKVWNDQTQKLEFGTGLAVEIPQGYVGLLFPRSSISKTLLTMANSVGVIDSGFRGEIKAVFHPGGRPVKNYEVGDRVAQLVIVPFESPVIVEVDQLSDTERGAGGFGRTGW